MRKFIKMVLKLFGLALLSLMLLIAFSAWQVYDYAQHKRPLPRHADAVVVLGAAAWGNNPSPVFRERINHGVSLYRKNQVRKIIFTGGTPKFGYPTEAEVAKRYAQSKFLVPANDIILDTESHNTYDNVYNTRALMSQHELNSIIIVSDPDHLARALAIATHLGLNASVSATPSSRYYANRETRLKFMVMEVMALAYFRLQVLFKAV